MNQNQLPPEFTYGFSRLSVLFLGVVLLLCFGSFAVDVTRVIDDQTFVLSAAMSLIVLCAVVYILGSRMKIPYRYDFKGTQLTIHRFGSAPKSIRASQVIDYTLLNQAKLPAQDPAQSVKIELKLGDQSKITIHNLNYGEWNLVLKWCATHLLTSSQNAAPLQPKPLLTHAATDTAKKLNTRVGMSAIVLVFLFLGSIFVFANYRPLRILETLVFLSVLILPVSVWISRLLQNFFRSASTSNKTVPILIFTFLLSVPLISLPILINGYADPHPATTYTGVIESKSVSVHKNGGRSYKVFIKSPKKATLPLPFGDFESVAVSADAYAKVKVGVDRATLVIKPGRLGMPWVSYAYLEPLVSATN